MNRDERPRKIGAGIVFDAFLSKIEKQLSFLAGTIYQNFVEFYQGPLC
jgi:hypothetical protein